MVQAPLIIKNPHALPMYRDESQQGGGGRKRKVAVYCAVSVATVMHSSQEPLHSRISF